MAIDTRNKRFSMMNLGGPIYYGGLFEPDGSVDNADRFMLLFLYHGITLAAPSAIADTPGIRIASIVAESRIALISSESRVAHIPARNRIAHVLK